MKSHPNLYALVATALVASACNPKESDTENDSRNRRVPPSGPELPPPDLRPQMPQPPPTPNVGGSPAGGTRSDYQPSTGPAGQMKTAQPAVSQRREFTSSID